MGERTKLTSVFLAVAQRQLENSVLSAAGSDLTSDAARDLTDQIRGTVAGAKEVAAVAAETPAKARRAVKAARFGLALAQAIRSAGAK